MIEKLVFDIEADNLFPDVTRMWCLCSRSVNNQDKEWNFGPNSNNWRKLLDNTETLIGHNIINFDLPVLDLIENYQFKGKVLDTLLMSQIQNFERFGSQGHSLKAWGEALGYPKVEHEDWTQYSKAMLKRCHTDVKINMKVYETLEKEYQKIIKRYPAYKYYLQAEQIAQEFAFQAYEEGWPIDVDKAEKLYKELAKTVKDLKRKLAKNMGTKVVAIDKKKGVVEIKHPKWIKSGLYDVHTARYFEIDQEAGLEDRPIEGPYCRVAVRKLSIDSSQDVKIFLYRQGWIPTEWNQKKNPDGSRKRMSPKITEDSLEFLGGYGKDYKDYTVARSRLNVLTTWLENIDQDGRLHGELVLIGTPSLRARHKIIANIPTPEKPYGKEIRELFITDPGWTFIGADSKGNQARGLAWSINDPKFTEIILSKDIHQFNADNLTKILRNMGIDKEVTRSQAKRIFYAILFGASGNKLWLYIFGKGDLKNGKKLKDSFLKAIPGFHELVERLENEYTNNLRTKGKGFITSIVGTPIYVDAKYKLLVYWLQHIEKITCSTALMFIVRDLRKAKIPYKPLIYYHDETDFQVPDKYAEQAKIISEAAFREAPKLYGINIMDGETKIGKTWLECH